MLYTNGSIERPYSYAAKSLDEYREYLLGADFDRQFRAEFGSEAEYPQITINGKHIGSLKETLQYFNQKVYYDNLELTQQQAVAVLLLIDREQELYATGDTCPAVLTTP